MFLKFKLYLHEKIAFPQVISFLLYISCLQENKIEDYIGCGIIIDDFYPLYKHKDFPGSSDGKASVYNVGDLGLIPGSGRFPGEGNGNPLQYSCLENPMDGGAWCPWGCKESDMTKRLHDFTHLSIKSCWKHNENGITMPTELEVRRLNKTDSKLQVRVLMCQHILRRFL